MGLATDGDFAREIFRAEPLHRIKHQLPVALPALHDFFARRVGGNDELLVAVAVGLLAIAGEEVSEARTHVAHHVFHQDRDTVGLRVEHGEKLFVAELFHGGVGLQLDAAQAAKCFVEVNGSNVGHTRSLCVDSWISMKKEYSRKLAAREMW